MNFEVVFLIFLSKQNFVSYADLDVACDVMGTRNNVSYEGKKLLVSFAVMSPRGETKFSPKKRDGVTIQRIETTGSTGYAGRTSERSCVRTSYALSLFYRETAPE